MTPLEVGQLTIAEINEVLEGARRREERQIRQMAYWVANLMNATGNFSKSPMTPDRLLGKKSSREAMKQRAEARKRAERAPNK